MLGKQSIWFHQEQFHGLKYLRLSEDLLNHANTHPLVHTSENKVDAK